MDNKGIKKLESELWEAADLLRQGSKLTSQQYCMPVLGLLFLRYAYSRYKKVEEEILKLHDFCENHGVVLTIWGLDEIANQVHNRYRSLAKDYLVLLPAAKHI